MAARKESNGQIVRDGGGNGQAIQTRGGGQGLVGFLESIKSELARALPKHLTADRMARLAITALRTTKDLDKCSLPSFGASIMACAALGLEPNTPLGQAWLIPRKNRRQNCIDCTLIIGYSGLLDLARRAGAQIKAFAVYQDDQFEYQMGLEPKLVHIPSDNPERGEDPKQLTHVYAIIRSPNMEPEFAVLTRAQVERRRKQGASGYGTSTPWDTHYEEMALKTAVRAAFKWSPRSSEMHRAEALESAQERGHGVFDVLPEDSAKALLGAGYGPPEPTTVDVEYEGATPPHDSETGEVKEAPPSPEEDGR